MARKILHMAMGLFALALHWLAPWQAALCALAALAHNLWLFPHYGMKKLERPEEKARGYSGMIGYPAIVLVLILLCWKPYHRPGIGTPPWDPGHYPYDLAVAAGAWAILAFGDAAAALAGIFLKGPALPWNPGKRWTGWLGFTAVGGLFCGLWTNFVSGGEFLRVTVGSWWVFFFAAFLAGLVESLPGHIDDNLTVPLMSWLALTFAVTPGEVFHDAQEYWQNHPWAPLFWILFVLNLILALTARYFRWVDTPSCALGLLFGSVVLVFSGIEGYGFLLLFYFISQFSTYFGKRIKEQRGIAEPDQGRRGVGSVFSKGLMPALFALVSPAAMVAALAVYAADTAASEIGKTSRGNAWSLTRFRIVPPGTVGAISWKGTLAGLVTIALFAAAAYLVALSPVGFAFYAREASTVSLTDAVILSIPSPVFTLLMVCMVAAVVISFFAESVMNEVAVQRGFLSKEAAHLALGGLAGALTHGLFIGYFGLEHLLYLMSGS